MPELPWLLGIADLDTAESMDVKVLGERPAPGFSDELMSAVELITEKIRDEAVVTRRRLLELRGTDHEASLSGIERRLEEERGRITAAGGGQLQVPEPNIEQSALRLESELGAEAWSHFEKEEREHLARGEALFVASSRSSGLPILRNAAANWGTALEMLLRRQLLRPLREQQPTVPLSCGSKRTKLPGDVNWTLGDLLEAVANHKLNPGLKDCLDRLSRHRRWMEAFSSERSETARRVRNAAVHGRRVLRTDLLVFRNALFDSNGMVRVLARNVGNRS